MKRLIALFICVSQCAFLLGASSTENLLIRDMLLDYGYYRENGAAQVEAKLEGLKQENPDTWWRWQQIMDFWRSAEDYPQEDGQLPDGLPEDDSLCIVVLGYKLAPAGGIRKELEGRLNAALASAVWYPNAWVLCTGGGTATGNGYVTEAGQMAKWLIDHGVDAGRIIVENQSHTTGQNARLSCDILERDYPQVKTLAIISSDYHIPWAVTLFQAETILRGDAEPNMDIAACASFHPTEHENYPFYYQAAGLLELAGMGELAERIYLGGFGKPALR